VIYDVDGTYEDVEVERISDRTLAEAAEADAVAKTEDPRVSVELDNRSKKAKARARKHKRDAAKDSALTSALSLAPTPKVLQEQTVPGKAETLIVAKQTVVPSPAAARVRAEVSHDVWSESKEGCKTYATRDLPCDRVGWVIGPNGSKIKQIQDDYVVVVRIDALTVSVYGKHERVTNAMKHIDYIINQESWIRPSKPGASGSSLTKGFARWKEGQALADKKAQQYQSSRK